MKYFILIMLVISATVASEEYKKMVGESSIVIPDLEGFVPLCDQSRKVLDYANQVQGNNGVNNVISCFVSEEGIEIYLMVVNRTLKSRPTQVDFNGMKNAFLDQTKQNYDNDATRKSLEREVEKLIQNSNRGGTKVSLSSAEPVSIEIDNKHVILLRMLRSVSNQSSGAVNLVRGYSSLIYVQGNVFVFTASHIENGAETDIREISKSWVTKFVQLNG